MAPDFAAARRELRRARVSAAVGEPVDSDVVGGYRDRLLQLLARDSVAEGLSFDGMDDDQVETVISIAVAAVVESGQDAAAVLLMCVKVLSADGQFARMTLLAERLERVSADFSVERPYWQVALAALADAIRGRRRKALGDLNERLGIGRDTVPGGSSVRTPQQVEDVVAAAAVRSVLAGDDPEFVRQVRDRALGQGDASLLVFADALVAWADAVGVAAPAKVLPAADDVFATERLAEYMAGLRVQALFPAQVRALQAGATSDETRMVALPTSSGKTLLAEMRIVATLVRHPGSRAIYVAPYRLLARQVERELRPGLRRAGFDIRDLGSGYDPSALPAGEAADVIVCTPERLDGLMRLAASDATGHQEAAAFLDSSSVMVFDELHLIGRDGRGPRFELILARLRMRNPNLRVLGLAAATHGSQELSEWLGDEVRLPKSRRPTGTLELLWETGGTIKQRTTKNPSTVMDLPRKTAIDDAAALMLRFDEDYLPVLAICTTRTRAESLAKKVLTGHAVKGRTWREGLARDKRRTLAKAIEEVRALMGADHPLAQMMENGIAFHHAGVPTHALEQIEYLARIGLMRFVCATTTVAEGADLPFKVVVIPHLDFPGTGGRLSRDLYLNIIGRAGRANVAVEGMVFVLDSNARTLQGTVKNQLWQTSARDVLRGKLNNVPVTPRTVDDWNDMAGAESQLLAWLADPSSYLENQAAELSQRTFSYSQGNSTEKAQVFYVVEQILKRLEAEGYAVAGSPLKVTEKGAVAQLTGLSLPAVVRLNAAVERGRDGWLTGLSGRVALDEDVATQIARLVFETPEVLQHSLWFKRNAKAAAALPTLYRFAYQGDGTHEASDDYELDIVLVANWLMGAPYSILAGIADVAPNAQSLFGGKDGPKRVSDATEYIGKLTYPASWVWSGAQIVAGELGKSFPAFIRGAIEYGVPTESCVHLIERARVTRAAALQLSHIAGPTWDGVATWLLGDGHVDDAGFVLTTADTERLRVLRDELEAED